MQRATMLSVLAWASMPLFASCAPIAGPGLGETMNLQQIRHAKLWFAGEAENWELVSYELDELEEGFADVLKFHPTHKDAPAPLATFMPPFVDAPIREMRQAAREHDREAFERAYDHLTDGCNTCHQATKFGFNVVRRPPEATWFGNQDFRGLP